MVINTWYLSFTLILPTHMKNASKQILFVVIFTFLGLLLLQIPFTQIVGSKQHFSFFDFVAPASSGFLGSGFGALSVFIVKLTDLLIKLLVKKEALDLVSFVRLFPLVFAAIYFGTKSKKIAVVPALTCILLFVLHPEGRKVWFFSAFWLIPVFVSFYKNHLVLNSLGSTFTAHAIGSTAFLYAFNLKANIWISLIPQVVLERMVMALGIFVFYLVMNSLLVKLALVLNLNGLRTNPECVLFRKTLKKCV